MPELPEVETIRLGLQKFLLGHSITDIVIRLPKQFRGESKALIGAKAVAARRFGKGLVIDFNNDYSLAIHVKMTGQLLYSSARGSAFAKASADRPAIPHSDFDLPDKYTHVVFHLDRGAILFYRDMRQFGWVHVLPTQEVAEHKFFKSLGKEPLKDLSLNEFTKLLQRKTPIKLLLMDQSKIAGIGNIYANDALYRAQIHPKRPANSLSEKEVRLLFNAIEFVLKKGIEVGGASERDYVDVLGGRGQYQNFFQVYQKDGEPCKRCGTKIERIVIGGRGTFFCPRCQLI